MPKTSLECSGNWFATDHISGPDPSQVAKQNPCKLQERPRLDPKKTWEFPAIPRKGADTFLVNNRSGPAPAPCRPRKTWELAGNRARGRDQRPRFTCKFIGAAPHTPFGLYNITTKGTGGGPWQRHTKCIMSLSCSVVSTASGVCTRVPSRVPSPDSSPFSFFCLPSSTCSVHLLWWHFPFPFDWFPGVSLPAAPLFPGPRFRFSARRVALEIEFPNQAEYGFSERGPPQYSMAWAAASTRNSIMHWRIPCFYTLSCYHPLAMSECRRRALKLSLSQACFWAPQMRPILVTKTRPRSLRQTLEAPNLGPQFWDQEK